MKKSTRPTGLDKQSIRQVHFLDRLLKEKQKKIGNRVDQSAGGSVLSPVEQVHLNTIENRMYASDTRDSKKEEEDTHPALLSDGAQDYKDQQTFGKQDASSLEAVNSPSQRSFKSLIFKEQLKDQNCFSGETSNAKVIPEQNLVFGVEAWKSTANAPAKGHTVNYQQMKMYQKRSVSLNRGGGKVLNAPRDMKAFPPSLIINKFTPRTDSDSRFNTDLEDQKAAVVITNSLNPYMPMPTPDKKKSWLQKHTYRQNNIVGRKLPEYTPNYELERILLSMSTMNPGPAGKVGV